MLRRATHAAMRVSERRVVMAGLCLACAAMAGCYVRQFSMDPTLAFDAAVEREPFVLEHVWTAVGNWTDVHVEPRSGEVYGLRKIRWNKDESLPRGGSFSAEVCRIGPGGAIEEVITIENKDHQPNRIAVCRLSDGRMRIATIGMTRKSVEFFDDKGGRIWEWGSAGSAQAICAGDVDGDGTDEVFIATTDGVHAVTAIGEDLWSSKILKWTWDIAFVPAAAERGARVVAMEMGDSVTILDGSGKVELQIGMNTAGSDVAVRRLGDGSAEVICVESRPLRLQSVRLDGVCNWFVTDDHPDWQGYVSDIAVSPDGQWVAVSLRNWPVIVWDAETGRRVASMMPPAGIYPEVAWAARGEGKSPLLLEESAAGIVAYELREVEGAKR